ncbi:succinate dehydrogenase, hydrophobic membrane anchor protein [Shimia sp. R11_0]|uniref:Succinate dehydrogenase hydrophobic membrane anchor subunit n=1 Tax=Shimia marina TaxID=321267 RepID=A0A0P1EUE8_9RHOB|nr:MULTISPECIES: succinate dehydrogenase, hydrophobic membrane anchor protein [Shimia]MBO9478344.1 succinate dehydrogenase, hydrophobic membrane anchor protein [Shimia sp. R11_0]CUH54297.1 succinate dehydrogenase, hydrophobic membrane anchor protein [Shimia marina]SFD99808.1 succinate dehydrogenase subunit D [Shimia marina]
MNFLTDRKRAQGMGASGQGTHHHWQMMVSSTLLVVLIPAFVITFGLSLGGTYEEVLAFYAKPVPAIISALTLIVGVVHIMREAQMAIEDYMHGLAEKLTYIAVGALCYTMIAVGLFALVKLAL